MERQKVVSSNIGAVGYDGTNQILEVQFTSGKVYQYSGVPKEIYENMLQAESKGRYFASNIRNTGGKYPAKLVVEEVKPTEEKKEEIVPDVKKEEDKPEGGCSCS
jgi:hypothetical protein